MSLPRLLPLFSFRNFSLRRLAHTLHLWLGLASGLVMLIVALTGATQAFEEDLRNFFQHDFLFVPRMQASVGKLTNTRVVAASEIVAVMKRQFSQEKIEQVRFRFAATPVQPDPAASEIPTFLVMTASNHTYSIHPNTGQILGVRDMRTDALSIALELHTNLLLKRAGLHDLGEEIIKWNVAVFAVLLLTGIVLWMPANMRLLGNVIKKIFRVGELLKQTIISSEHAKQNVVKLNYDLHRTAGFYALLVVLVIVWTGLFWMFDTVEDSVYALFGQKKTFALKPQSKKIIAENGTSNNAPIVQTSSNLAPKKFEAVLDEAYSSALRYGTPYFVSMQFPKKETDAVRLVVRYPYRFVRKQSVFYFDRYSAELLKTDLHQAYTTPDKIRVMNYDLHTGKILGFGGKLAWLLAALFTASLPITGTLLWWNKRKNKNRNKQNNQQNNQRSSTTSRVHVPPNGVETT